MYVIPVQSDFRNSDFTVFRSYHLTRRFSKRNPADIFAGNIWKIVYNMNHNNASHKFNKVQSIPSHYIYMHLILHFRIVHVHWDSHPLHPQNEAVRNIFETNEHGEFQVKYN